MDFQQARTNMVDQQVRPWSVFNDKVLATLSQVPREMFVPPEYLNLAYSDTDIPIGDGQTMLAPKIVGKALEALSLSGQERVLEIGTGTGYVTTCLSKLVESVLSVEIDPMLLMQAKKSLGFINCRNVSLELGNGVLGWKTAAPFDVIIITGSYPLGVPHAVCEQLHPIHGRLFAICGKKPVMEAILIERYNETHYRKSSLFETSVPALLHVEEPPKFQF